MPGYSTPLKKRPAYRNRKNTRSVVPRAMSRTNRAFRSGQLFNFHRSEWQSNQTVTCDATGFAGLGLEFRLDQITDHLNFANLFDAFRIAAVCVEIIPLNNDYNLPNIQPQVCQAVDRDDSTAPTSMEKLLCRKNAKLRPFNRKITKYVKPNAASNVYSAGISSDYKQTMQPCWLDLTSGTGANVAHYGVKVAFQATPLQDIDYHVRTKYYLQFKEPIVR